MACTSSSPSSSGKSEPLDRLRRQALLARQALAPASRPRPAPSPCRRCRWPRGSRARARWPACGRAAPGCAPRRGSARGPRRTARRARASAATRWCGPRAAPSVVGRYSLMATSRWSVQVARAVGDAEGALAQDRLQLVAAQRRAGRQHAAQIADLVFCSIRTIVGHSPAPTARVISPILSMPPDCSGRRLPARDPHTVDSGAVGRPEILDLQHAAGQQETRMAARHGRMRQHDVGLIDVTADDHALALAHQLVEIQVEAILAAAAVGAPEVQRARGHHRGRGPRSTCRGAAGHGRSAACG